MNGRDETPSKPANELEGLIRDHEVSNNDKREFIWAMFEVLRDYDLLTDD